MKRIENIHSQLYLHRDLKSENFLIGLKENSNTIYAIDFGLSKRYRDPDTRKHIEYKNNKHLTGTARYASINAHFGIEQSRRDDLEAIYYILLYFARGSLPWQGLNANNKEEKFRLIMESKMSTPLDTLCQNIPEEFKKSLEYIKTLKFEEDPDYKMLNSLLVKIFQKNNLENDMLFDWKLKDVVT